MSFMTNEPITGYGTAKHKNSFSGALVGNKIGKNGPNKQTRMIIKAELKLQ